VSIYIHPCLILKSMHGWTYIIFSTFLFIWNIFLKICTNDIIIVQMLDYWFYIY
jgi:hypothetical protein